MSLVYNKTSKSFYLMNTKFRYARCLRNLKRLAWLGNSQLSRSKSDKMHVTVLIN